VTSTIAILTDFGLDDTYVGVMKSVIISIQPEVQLIDLTHAIPPGDIQAGAFELWRAAPYLPPGCVILGVVDPGVGTGRRPVACDLGDIRAVGPDNGLFSYLLFDHPLQAAAQLGAPGFRLADPSATFHGRDLFAPAAAYLAGGLGLETIGPPMDAVVQLTPPRLKLHRDGAVEGEIIHRDHFGNLVTTIGRVSSQAGKLQLSDWTGRGLQRMLDPASDRLILPNGARLELGRTFGDVPAGTPLAYTGSAGLIEIGVNSGDASAVLGLNIGDTILLDSGEG